MANKVNMKELQDITITVLNSSTKEVRYLITTNGSFFEANALTADLIILLRDADTEEDGINNFIAKYNKYSVKQIKDLLDNHLLPKIRSMHNHPSPFLYQRDILAKEQIRKATKRLSVLFNKKFMIAAMIVFIAFDGLFFFMEEDITSFNNYTGIFSLLLLIAFVVLSSAFHELGHAAACCYCGVDHGGIGIGLYLNFPVLYTDVTNVWKLSRFKRCLVNFAGVYFQCLLLIVLIAVYMMTHYFVLKYLILIINFGFLLTLNPFFKFDGYWMASDILGVANLRQRSKEAIRYFMLKLFNKHDTIPLPYLLQLKIAAKVGFIVYSFIVNIFLAYYIFYIIPTFIFKFVREFPDEIYQLVLYCSSGMAPSFSLIRNISIQALFMSLIVYMAIRIIKSIIDKNRKRTHTNENI